MSFSLITRIFCVERQHFTSIQFFLNLYCPPPCMNCPLFFSHVLLKCLNLFKKKRLQFFLKIKIDIVFKRHFEFSSNASDGPDLHGAHVLLEIRSMIDFQRRSGDSSIRGLAFPAKLAKKVETKRFYLQKSVPIQPKTSNILPKFCQPTLSDVACGPAGRAGSRCAGERTARKRQR